MVYYVIAISKEIKTILKVNFWLQFKLIPSWQLCGFIQSWQIHCNHVHWWNGVKLLRVSVPNPGHYIMNLEYWLLETFWKQNINIFSPMHQHVLGNHGKCFDGFGVCVYGISLGLFWNHSKCIDRCIWLAVHLLQIYFTSRFCIT